MADDGGNIRGEEVLPRSDAEDERACILHCDDLSGVIVADDAEAVGALKTCDHLHDGPLEVAVIVHFKQINDDLGVGLAMESVAPRPQLIAQFGVVFYDAVVDDGKVAVV